jgi:hypothetical protein
MTRLSNRQYPMLRTFADEREGFYMSIHDAQYYDQRPFRSMLIRRWIVYRASKGFHITREGRAAWREFQATEIARKNPTLPLTAYFDPGAYGLKQPYGKTLHVVHRTAAA